MCSQSSRELIFCIYLVFTIYYFLVLEEKEKRKILFKINGYHIDHRCVQT